jgi:hypothetical protein
MRGHLDHTARPRDAIEIDLGDGEPIDLLARLGYADGSSIRARLARRHSAGLRERLARHPYPSPAR